MFNFPAIKVAFDLCSAMTFHTYLGGFVNDPAIAKCINIATTLPASTWKPLIKAKPVIKKKAENIHYQTKDGWIVGGKDAARLLIIYLSRSHVPSFPSPSLSLSLSLSLYLSFSLSLFLSLPLALSVPRLRAAGLESN